jgi:lambda family phage portal protein
MKIFGYEINKSNNIEIQDNTNKYEQVVDYIGDFANSTFNGDKFFGSFGLTKDYTWVDYWTLRRRSKQLFKENSYARGAIRRILRNEIYTGLNLEANPLSEILGMSEEEAIKWAEESELDFNLWANDPKQVDFLGENTLGELANIARQTALISGDALIVLRNNRKTGLPQIQIIDGCNVNSVLNVKVRKGHSVLNGVETDAKGKVVAYWVQNVCDDQRRGVGDTLTPLIESKRIPVFGEKSGRRIAWMVFGSDKLIHENRGEPILAAVLYMLKELDRYRDSEQRAATINAMIPLFVKKTQQTVGTGPFGKGATRRGTATVTDLDGTTRDINVSSNIPGQVVDKLAYGEEIQSFQTNRPNTGYKVFEETIINAFSWCLEIPPEIMRLLFQSNFSASRQANNELNVYLQYRFWKFGKEFYQPIYEEQLTSNILMENIKAPGYLEAKRTGDFRTVNAWTNAEWSGLSRPSVDINKDAKAAETSIGLRIATYDYWSRRITGMSFRNTLQKIARENKLMERAKITSSVDENNNGEPIQTGAEPQQNNQQEPNNINIKHIVNMMEEMNEKIEDIQEER